MERFEGNIAVVSGCNSGIGLQLTKDLIKKKLIVVGFGRREDRLKELDQQLNNPNSERKFYPMRVDVSKEEDVISAFEWIQNALGCPSILINNASIIVRDKILDYSAESAYKVFHINVLGYFFCAKEAIKLMKRNSVDGHVINIGSILGKIDAIDRPNLHFHSSVKHAVRQFTEGLRRELIYEKSRIKISLVNPGTVKTEMSDSYNMALPPSEILEAVNVSEVCLAVLNTPPDVTIPEVTVLPLHEK